MRMTPNYSYLFLRPLSPPQSCSFSLWLTKSLNGCHPTSFVSTLPKQNSSAQIKKIPDLSIHLSIGLQSPTTFTSDALVRNLRVTFHPHLSFFQPHLHPLPLLLRAHP